MRGDICRAGHRGVAARMAIGNSCDIVPMTTAYYDGLADLWRSIDVIGLGGALMQQCLEGLREAGITRCRILAFADNRAARGFYESIGCRCRDDLTVFTVDIP